MNPAPTIRAIVAGLGVLAAGVARAQGEWILIDRDMREHRVELTQLRDGVVSFTDDSGRARAEPVAGLLAVIHERLPEERPARDLPWLTQQMEMFGEEAPREQKVEPFVPSLDLTDGQRWTGAFAGASGEVIKWSLTGSVSLDVALDRVRAAQINGPIDAAGWPGVDDRVLLLNGDMLDGFIARIDESLRLETESGDLEVHLEQVAGFLVANPPAPPVGVMAWLADGSVIAADSVEVAVTGRVSLTLGSDLPDAVHRAATTDLLALLFDPGLIAGLSGIEPALVEYPPERLWGQAPVPDPPGALGLGAIDLAGPVRVVWELPRPAARLGATATLPPAMWAWGDCEVVVRTSDDTEILRERLRAERPSVEINLPLGGSRRITVEIASGAGGPVQDRVVLVRPMVRWQ